MVDDPPHQDLCLERRAIREVGPDCVERGPDSARGRSKKTEKYVRAALAPSRAILQGLQTTGHPVAQGRVTVFETGLKKIERGLQLGVAALLVEFADQAGESTILAFGCAAISRNEKPSYLWELTRDFGEHCLLILHRSIRERLEPSVSLPGGGREWLGWASRITLRRDDYHGR